MIELKGVSSGYGKKNIIEDVSLLIPKGKLVSVVGLNGSGKSTLIKTVVGIIKPTSGEIIIDKKRSDTLSGKERAQKIAYLAQGKSAADMTVKQLVLHGRFPYLDYPRRYSEKDIETAKKTLSELGLSELSGKPLSSLSGGMRQYAYIAMALTQDTDYILMDEPTTFLDISHRIELIKTFRSLVEGGKGIVAVMHDLPLAFTFSDAVAVIDKGRLTAFDTPEGIYKSGIVRDIFNIELEYSASDKYYHYKYII